MDRSLIIGALAGLALVSGPILMGGDSNLFLHAPSVLITLGGTIAATMINFPVSRVLEAFRIARRTVVRPALPVEDEIERILRFVSTARREGVLAIEAEAESLDDEFLGKGLRLVFDGLPRPAIREILEIEHRAIEERHQAAKGILEAMATYAPAFGLIGTLIGLVQMLQHVNDSEQMKAGMATSLLTTFYGALLANLVFLPMAGKLESRHRDEALLRQIVIEGVLCLEARESPHVARERLRSFLTGPDRQRAARTSRTEAVA